MNDDVLDPSPRARVGRGGMARRRSRRLVGAAVVVAITLVAWALWSRAAVRLATHHAPSQAAAALGRLRFALVSSLHGDNQLRTAAAVASASASITGLAVCGVHGDVVPDDAADVPTVAEPASAAEPPAASAAVVPTVAALPPPTPAEQRIFDAMRRSPDPFAHAAVLVLAPSGDPDDPSARLERLASSAIHSSDPRVYALAYRACRQVEARPAACAALSVGQWARLDVGNGAPWLYVLSDALRQNDTATADDALFHIAAAERVDDRSADVGAAAADHVPPGDDEATVAGWLMMARAMSMAMLPVQGLFTRCNPLATNDANRSQVCAAIADKLIDHGDSLLLESIGANLDRLVTGNAVRADRLRAEREALLATLTEADFSCSGLRRNLHRFQRSAQIGEVAALREARAQAASGGLGP